MHLPGAGRLEGGPHVMPDAPIAGYAEMLVAGALLRAQCARDRAG